MWKWLKQLWQAAIDFFIPKEEIDHKMILKSRDMGEGKFSVNGVIFYCDSHTEALNRYRRAVKDNTNG